MAYTTIKKSSDYFNTKLYTGNGSTQSITGVGFQPDFTWLKVRNAVGGHGLFDVIRGANKRLISNETSAEGTMTDGLTSFDSDGFSVGADGNTNGSSETYASWNWLGSNTTASNTDGSITSTVSVNTTSGFSIVSYTGTGATATVGHGLTQAPEISFYKIRTQPYNWLVYTGNVLSTDTLRLDASNAGFNSTNTWGTHGASTFGLSTNGDVNGSGENFISYHFHSVQGYSKIGSYVGNGSTDGTFVYTGFKPAFVLGKNASVAGEYWDIWDNKRDNYNVVYKRLFPNTSDAESTASAGDMDFLSNGFKLRNVGGNQNGSGNTHIYMAFAEEPLVGDNPATAR